MAGDQLSSSLPQATGITASVRSRTEVRAACNQFLTLAFITAILLPLIGTPLKWDPWARSQENRRLAQAPPTPRGVRDIGRFTDGFMVYFRDHFAFRNSLIAELALLRPREFNFYSDSQAIIGKDGWLFYRHAEDRDLLSYRGVSLFSESELNAWQRLLENRRSWLAARGIPYIVIILPNKQTIYPEFMPRGLEKIRDQSRLDQLVARLRESHSQIQLIDSRPALLAAKASDQVFQKTDTHWNSLGAYVGYGLIIEAVHRALPQKRVVPNGLDAFERRDSNTVGQDLARMLNLQNQFRENQILLIPRFYVPPLNEPIPALRISTVDDPSFPSAVMFHDSFADLLFPMLQPHFRRAVFQWSIGFDPRLIEQENPDVVISETIERTLDGSMPVDPPEMLERE
jgi:hypothetical protein